MSCWVDVVYFGLNLVLWGCMFVFAFRVGFAVDWFVLLFDIWGRCMVV